MPIKMNDNARMAEFIGTSARDDEGYSNMKTYDDVEEFNKEYRNAKKECDMTIAEYFEQNKTHWNKTITIEYSEIFLYSCNKKMMMKDMADMKIVAYRDWYGYITLYPDEQGKQTIWDRMERVRHADFMSA